MSDWNCENDRVCYEVGIRACPPSPAAAPPGGEICRQQVFLSGEPHSIVPSVSVFTQPLALSLAYVVMCILFSHSLAQLQMLNNWKIGCLHQNKSAGPKPS